MPILFHAGFVSTFPYKIVPKGISQSSANMKPVTLFNIVSSFPKLTVIGAHLGCPWYKETVRALERTPNLYFDISGGHINEYQRWLLDHLHFSALLSNGRLGGFSDKILMGLDIVYGTKENHEEIFERIKSWALFFKNHACRYTWGKDVEKIMQGNARKILKK